MGMYSSDGMVGYSYECPALYLEGFSSTIYCIMQLCLWISTQPYEKSVWYLVYDILRQCANTLYSLYTSSYNSQRVCKVSRPLCSYIFDMNLTSILRLRSDMGQIILTDWTTRCYSSLSWENHYLFSIVVIKDYFVRWKPYYCTSQTSGELSNSSRLYRCPG